MTRAALLTLTAAAVAHAANPTPQLPLFFLPNQGQAPAGIRYMVKAEGLTAWFRPHDALLRTPAGTVRLAFEGARVAPIIDAGTSLPGRANFLAADPVQSHTGLPLYDSIRYRDLYPGIDLVYSGSAQRLKSDFVISPGADPSAIRVRYALPDTASNKAPLRLAADGALIIPIAGRELREEPPVLYQDIDGRRTPVEGAFEIRPDQTVSFRIGRYDRRYTLVIDPVLSYSTLLGGAGFDNATAIAVNAAGEAFVTGYTDSTNMPVMNAAQSFTGGGNDVFVAKLNSTGNGLVYCTYLGGSADDRAYAIAVDATGAAYVAGATTSRNFPMRTPYQSKLNGSRNAFIFKLNPAGNGLVYSTYLGGNASDAANGIAVDGGGSAYVTGETTSFAFPTTGFQRSQRGGQEAFVARLSSDGTSLLYSTYLGGSSDDRATAIALDGGNTAWITGSTYSTDFPTVNPRQSANAGGQDAFIAHLSFDGSALLYASYLGGTGGTVAYPEVGQGIAVDNSNNIYVTGVTSSANFPILGGVQTTRRGLLDAFVTKIGSTGTILYSTYLGGSGADYGTGIAIDSNGGAFVTGYTYSTDLPTIAAAQSASGGDYDAFVAKLSPAGDALHYLSYLGGNGSDAATGLALDAAGNVFIAGYTLSTNFPTLNAYQTLNSGNYGAFISKFTFNVAPVTVSVSPATGTGASQPFTFTFSDSAGATDLTTVSVLFNSTASTTNACAITYNRAANTLALLTDAGTAPSTALTPGSGSQQNTQCILAGSGASASLSGNLLTLTLPIAFLGPFNGAKNLYMSATSPFGATGFQSKGAWTVAFTVSANAVTPANASGSSQTFTLQYSDDAGATDLTSVSFLLNSSTGTANACAITYNRAANTLMLLTDGGGAGTTISPGTGTLQNSQCSLNGAASTAVLGGSNLTLNLALTFFGGFSGAKNLYLSATSPFGNTGWQNRGTYTVAATLTAATPTPSSGSGVSQTFTFPFTDTAGANDLTSVSILFNTTTATTGACAITYNRAANTLILLTDAGAAPAATIGPGAGTQQNTQCTLNGVASTVAISGTSLTLNLAVSFLASFAGAKNVYMSATSPYGTTGWQNRGTWTVSSTLTAVSVSPATGTGTTQLFTAVWTDTAGATDIATASLLIGATTSTSSACAITYDRAANTLVLLTDAGAAPGSAITPGSGSMQNTQCNLSGVSSSVAISGNTLTLNLTIKFINQFAGAKNIYMSATSGFGNLAFQLMGTWTAVTTGVQALAVTPASGVGAAQTFTLQFSDSSGATDIITAGFLINTSATTGLACSVTYSRPGNSLALQTDAGGSPPSTLPIGSTGTQQNSQCILNGAGSTAVLSGNNLTLTISVSFLGAFAGAKNVYLSANTLLTVTGWQQKSTWTVAFNSAAVSVTSPNTKGNVQTFTSTFTDEAGAADLATVTMLLGTSTATTNACAVIYNRAANTLSLLTDAGAAPASGITPGTTATQQNSQCILKATGSAPAISGNTLTLALSLQLLPAFIGSKTIYLADTATAAAGVALVSKGTFNVTFAVSALGVSPSGGSGAVQTFSAQFSDEAGVTDFTTLTFMAGTSTSTANSCAVTYTRAANTFSLLTNAGALPASGITPGSGSQQNSQCTLNGTGSSVAISGNSITINVSLSFAVPFAGDKGLYVAATAGAAGVSMQTRGAYTVAFAINAVSVTPATGTGSSQTFTAQFNDDAGASDIASVSVLIGTSSSTFNNCVVNYLRGSNALALLTDAGTMPASTILPGSSATQQNSQCTLAGTGSSASLSGTGLTLNIALTFTPAFVGAKNVYLAATAGLANVAAVARGAWTVGFNVAGVSVTSASNRGNVQTFTATYSDEIGAADLSTVTLLFSTSTDPTNACSVTYYRASNSLALLTDTGAVPAATIVPGTTATQQNSQCTLKATGSSASISGTTLTLNVSLSFFPAFVGAKNIYLSATAGAGTTVPVVRNTYTVAFSVAALGVSPSGGTGSAQTFSAQFTDEAGVADFNTVTLMVGTSTSTASSCAVTYTRGSNTFSLLTDAGAMPATGLTPGSGSQQNSQCTLYGAGSSVAVSGTSLTITASLSFFPSFAGSKATYVAATAGAANVSMQTRGAYTVSFTVAAISVTPASGTGSNQVFSSVFTDDLGATDISAASVLIGASTATTNSCVVTYNRAANTLALLTDSGGNPATNLTPGTANTQQNSQCTLSAANSSATISGTSLTLNLALTFTPAFTGAKNVYLSATAGIGNLAPVARGTWTVGFNVAAVSVTSPNTRGNVQTFTATFTDELGATDISSVTMLVATSTSTASACAVTYTRSTNSLALLTDTGATPSTTMAPGSTATQQNTQCTLKGTGSSVTLSGNTLTLNLALTFTPAFMGAKTIYLAVNAGAANVALVSKGAFTVSFAVSALGVSPSGGTGSAQTFSAQFSDEAGVTDFNTLTFMVGTSASTTNSCAVVYTRSTNTFALVTDAGTTPAGITPGSGTQQNTQCRLNGAGSSIGISGNFITISVSLTFFNPFAGDKGLYVAATAGAAGVSMQTRGAYTVAF